jgi:hypothetical protein
VLKKPLTAHRPPHSSSALHPLPPCAGVWCVVCATERRPLAVVHRQRAVIIFAPRWSTHRATDMRHVGVLFAKSAVRSCSQHLVFIGRRFSPYPPWALRWPSRASCGREQRGSRAAPYGLPPPPRAVALALPALTARPVHQPAPAGTRLELGLRA